MAYDYISDELKNNKNVFQCISNIKVLYYKLLNIII
jgi:hypothetical protein